MEARAIGLIVNSASEVLRIPPSEIEEPHNVFQEGELNYITGVGKLKGRLVILLDLNKILRAGRAAASRRSRRFSPKSRRAGTRREVPRPGQERNTRDECRHHLTTQVPLTEAGIEASANTGLPGVRHVFRRAPHPFPARPPATPPQSVPDGFVLQLLPPAHEPGRQEGARRAAREPDRQRDEFFPHPAAARTLPERQCWRKS